MQLYSSLICECSYKPQKSDILDACLHGHAEVLDLLPRNIELPVECMERSVRSGNAKTVYFLRKRMPDFKFTKALLKESVASKSDDVCLAVFDCGMFKSLPKGIEVDLVRHKMRKSMEVFDKIGLPVYTAEAFLEACRICNLDLIRDVYECGQPAIDESSWDAALGYIFVSSSERKERLAAHAYVEFQRSKTRKRPLDDDQRSLHDDVGSAKRLQHADQNG